MSHNKSSDKDSFYDSGRADSGFLSGALNSELISGEIPPEETPRDGKSGSSRADHNEDKNMDKGKDDYMRLDSGVDLVSDQMSDLYIEEEAEIPAVQISLAVTAADKEEPSWQLYFQQDDEGDTQLHIAIIHGFIEVVFNLVRMVPSPEYLNIRNDLRQTALHLAVLTSQPRILRRLIVAGADPGQADRNGNTPLHLATYAGDAQCVRALTEKVASHEVSAAQLRYTPTCPRKIPSLADMVNYEGLTSVHLAAMSGHFGILKHLVKCGADVDAREWKSGRTVLHLAAEVGNDTLAVLLLRELMADPDMPNYAGRTAYHVGRRNTQFLKTLVAHGATPEPEYFTSDEEDDDIDDLQSFDNGFRDLVGQGRLINAA
uniref:NF-kappa-B inhibitor cactus n=1 Tax=Lygus hesperus TaxID=30085 RepID=A0A0A9WQD0_LYGHE